MESWAPEGDSARKTVEVRTQNLPTPFQTRRKRHINIQDLEEVLKECVPFWDTSALRIQTAPGPARRIVFLADGTLPKQTPLL